MIPEALLPAALVGQHRNWRADKSPLGQEVEGNVSVNSEYCSGAVETGYWRNLVQRRARLTARESTNIA